MATSPPSSKVDGRTLTQYEFLNVYGALYINGVQFNPTPQELANYNLIQSTQDWLDSTIDLGGGVRQLEEDATYFVNGTVVRTFQLQVNGFNVITGNFGATSVDFYAGTSDSFTIPTAGDGVFMEKVTFAGSDGSGSTFMSASNTAGFVVIDNAVVLHDNFGTCSSFSVVMTNSSIGLQSQSIKNGIVWNATNGFSLNIRNTAFNSDNTTTGTMIDTSGATGILSGILLSGLGMTDGALATAINIAPNSGGHTVDARSQITDCNLSSFGTAIGGYTPADLYWTVDARGADDTVRDAKGIALNGAALTTVIPSTGGEANATKINAVWTDDNSSQYTVDASGTFTANILDSQTAKTTLTMSIEPATGSNKILSAYAVIDGVLDSTSIQSVTADNGRPQLIHVPVQPSYDTGTTLEWFVTSNDGTDIVCTNCKAFIN